MSTEANKKLVQQIYADSASRSGTTFVDNLADDASWIVTGQYSWSHEFKGKDAILNGAEQIGTPLLVSTLCISSSSCRCSSWAGLPATCSCRLPRQWSSR